MIMTAKFVKLKVVRNFVQFFEDFLGSIVQSAVCRPAAMNLAYNNLKRSSFKAAQRVDRRVIQLGKNETPMGIR